MASSSEEAYEVNLGNKQLLALFFIVTGFFALFFCAGYMIGFGHGETTPGLVQVDEAAPEPAPPALPATLRQDPPAPPPPVAAASPKPSPAATAPSQPKPADPKPAPKRTAPAKPSPATTAAAAPKPKPAPAKPAAASAANQGGYYLQVAAVRAQADAAQLAGKLKSRGYPAGVNAGKGDGWQRVVVGPFSSPEAAQSFKSKLTKDGFDTMLRKL